MKRTRLRRTRLEKKGRPTVRQLDALCRAIVFARDGNACTFCAKTARLQWCHVKSRRYASARHLLENCLTLCAGCHLDQHANPLKWASWFMKRYPERVQKLRDLEWFPQKVDRNLILLALKEEAKKYGVKA